MKIVGVSGAGATVAPPDSCGLATACFCQRARNSATNGPGSMSSCWTNVFRQYVAKKLESDGSRDAEQPAKKNGMRSRDNRLLLDIRRRNRPSQSGMSQPMNSIG